MMIKKEAKALEINGKDYRVLSLLGKGKGGYSWLVEDEGRHFVLKEIHHEPCDYYTFGNKIESERRDYGLLRAAGIRVPEMLAIDIGNERILKEYMEGPTAMELVKEGTLPDWALDAAAEMAELAMAAGLNIDYYPTNFILCDGALWYIDYECNPYDPQWDFENWGRAFWLSSSQHCADS